MKRLISALLHHKWFCLPVIVLCFLCCSIIPIGTATITNNISERLDKYNQLNDEYVYRFESYQEYLENSDCFEEGYTCCYSSTLIEEKGKNFLLIHASKNPSSFGVPYFDTFLNIECNFDVENMYYTSDKTIDAVLKVEDMSLAKAGIVDINIPHLDPYSDEKPVSNIIVYFSASGFQYDDDVQSVYNLKHIYDYSFEINREEIGKSIKETYINEYKSLLNFSSNMSFFAFFVFCCLELFASFLVAFRIKKEYLIKRFYFIKEKQYLFFDSLKFNILLLLIPSLGGYLISVILRMLFISIALSIIDISMIAIIIFITILSSTYPLFIKGELYGK